MLTKENRMERKASILVLSDDDLDNIGIDSKKMTDEQFQKVVEDLEDYFNENFLAVLKEMTAKYKAIPSFEKNKT